MQNICRKRYKFISLALLIFPIFTVLFFDNHTSFGETDDLNFKRERTIEFSYSVLVKNVPPNSRHLEICLPVPKSDSNQMVNELKISCDYPYTFQSDPDYNNSILVIESNEEIAENVSVSMDFLVTRKGYKLSDKVNSSSDNTKPEHLKRYLQPDRLVPIDGIVAENAHKLTNKDMTAMEKSRVLYDHVVSSVSYDKSGKGWGHGDAVYACNVRKGNCTDFHSMYIGMARACGIPSRFVIGFSIPDGKSEGVIGGYHCWAEFFINGLGWVSIDASEASKHAEKRDLFYGGLDANRVQFTIGRDVRIKNDPAIEPLNYFIYPHVRIDEKTYQDVEYRFWFKDLDTVQSKQH